MICQATTRTARITIVYICLLVFLGFACFSVKAQQVSPPPASKETSKAPADKPITIADTIAKLNLEIDELSKTLLKATGDEHDAIQLRLYQKNELLRDNITKGIERQEVDKTLLIKLVNNQVKYTQQALRYINKKVALSIKQIDEAKVEEKLSMLGGFKELQQFLDLMYQWSWQNQQWQARLDIAKAKDETVLREKFQERMSVLSASIEYFYQQSKNINTQLKVSPESEQGSLQIQSLVASQRLEISVESLRMLYKIAGEMGMDTTDYRQLIFETTGNITYDLLDIDVLLSILASGSERLLKWLGQSAPAVLFQIMLFVLVLLIANLLAKLTRRIVSNLVTTKNFNFSKLMQDFFVSISSKVVWFIGIMIGLSQLGLNLTPLLTGFGIAGIIIGLALQDSLSNLASGMMLLIYRPFDVGDFVHAGGVNGEVLRMSLVNTTIRTFDNQIIIVPNNKIWGDVIKNVTHERVRRVDMVFGIGYADDLLKAEKVLIDIAQSHPKTLKSPELNVRVHTLNTSSVDFIVRPWVKTADYWDVYWDITKEVKLRFDREGISIPFPQQDVHLHMVKGDESTGEDSKEDTGINPA